MFRFYPGHLHCSLNKICFRSRNTLVSAKICPKFQREAGGGGEVKRGLARASFPIRTDERTSEDGFFFFFFFLATNDNERN